MTQLSSVAKPCHLGLAITLALAAWPALAQQQDKSQLETVTVTATRRVEDIKDVPAAVSTISGDALDALASSGQDVRMLSGRLPSLNIESSFGRAFPRFYIRGYGNTDFHLNASQPVSLVYDDVVQENPILKGFPVFDVKAVEVIAGPQGTLFGRNTPAGVVKFDSVAPSQKQDGYVSVSAGNFSTYSIEGAANLPLTGDWAARISVQDQHRGDWVTNSVPAGVTLQTPKTEGYDDVAVRLQALYKTSNFSALFNIHHRDLDGSPRLFRANIYKPGTNDLVDGFDPKKASFDGKNEQKVKATGGSARLKWSLADFDIYSITGIETVQPFSRGDVDGGYGASYAPPYGPGFIPFMSETSDALHGHRQLTQEVRIESKGDSPLKWQAGVFGFDEHYTWESVDYTATPNLSTDTHQTNRAYAVFGSATYQVTSQLKLGGGLRYTDDKRSLNSYAPAVNGGPLDASNGLSANTKNNKWTWDASAVYALDTSTSLYAKIGTGFRASAIQPASGFGPMSLATKPETLTSYEFGVKSDFWNRRARLSADVFSYDVKNLQLTEVGGGGNSNTLKMAKKATGQGLEINLDLLPIDNLMVHLSGSINDTKIKDSTLTVGGCGGGCTMLNAPAPGGGYYIDGNPLPNAPKYVANANLRYGFPLTDGSEIYVYTDWTYRSSVLFPLYKSAEFTGKPLTEGGLRGGYLWNNGKYEAAVFVRNITNKIVGTGEIDFNNLTGFINDPRTYGVQFKALF